MGDHTHPADINPKQTLYIEQRKKILMKAGRCLFEKKTSLESNCHSSINLLNCNGRHHVSICVKNWPAGNSSNSLPADSTNQPSSSNPASRDVASGADRHLDIGLQVVEAHPLFPYVLEKRLAIPTSPFFVY